MIDPLLELSGFFLNKLDESGNVLLNKSRLVIQGFSQIEGVDFEETFAPVARLESIRIILAFASHMDFKLHQMDVKSAFLNGFLEEDVEPSLTTGQTMTSLILKITNYIFYIILSYIIIAHVEGEQIALSY